MKKRLRKVLSLALALLTVVGMMPVAALVVPVEVQADGMHIITGCEPNSTIATYEGGVQVKFVTDAGIALADNSMATVINALNSALVTTEAAVTGYDPQNYKFQLRSDEPNQPPFAAELTYSNGAFAAADPECGSVPNGYDLHLEVVPANSGGSNPPPPAQQNYTVDFGAGTWTVGGTNVSATIGGTAVSGRVEVASNAVINFSNINRETMDIYCESEDHFNMVLAIDDSGNASLGNSFPNGKVIALVVEPKGTHQAGGGGEDGQPGGIDVKINLGCPQDYQGQTWTGVPMINHQQTTVSYNDTYKMADNQLCQGVCVWVLEDGKTYDGARSDYGDVAADGFIHFNYHGQGNKRKIVVASQWSDVIEAIIINGTPYTNFVSYNSPMEDYMAHFAGQMVYNVFDVPAVQDEVYSVQVALRPLDESECKVGNFRWSSDPKLEGTDYYVGNAIMELVSIKFNGQEFKGDDAIKRCQYVGSYHANEPDYQGTMFGEMFVPAGAEVTMLITPEQGYQVTSFELSGDQFVASDTVPGQFTFTVGIGNMHIGGKTKKVEDVIKATATNVSNVEASINAGGDYSAGSANLSIANASPSAEKKTEFTAAAGEQNVDLIGGDNAYLAIDLEQVIYKANSADDPNKENETWTQEVHNLGNGYSDVTMKFGNDVDVSTVVLLHNIGDGEDFETIRPISYDATNHTATFRIKSFSTFAIAKAHTKTTPVTPSDTNTNTNTNSGGSSAPAATTVDTVPKTAETFPIVPIMVVAIVSFATMAVVVFERKRRA
ncbi:MAG: hypothetical protein K5659_09525 [Lachnospiraceae bacterium]|nr:hypothetical protein [Lachnospiraceae bacterium]